MKWINKIKLRKIHVLGENYLWKRGHYHLEEFKYSKCVEKVIVYCEGYKNSPLHLFFREEDNLLIQSDPGKRKWCVGYPDNGVIWLYQEDNDENIKEPSLQINLNRPAVIRKLIEHFLKNEWSPKTDKTTFIFPEALRLLDLIDFSNKPKGINNEDN